MRTDEDGVVAQDYSNGIHSEAAHQNPERHLPDYLGLYPGFGMTADQVPFVLMAYPHTTDILVGDKRKFAELRLKKAAKEQSYHRFQSWAVYLMNCPF